MSDESLSPILSDKTNVIGLDANEYDEEDFHVETSVSTYLLQDALELLETLGWESVDIVLIDPPEDETMQKLLHFRPSRCEFNSERQAGISIAPKRKDGGSDD